MASPNARILVADDSSLARAALRDLLVQQNPVLTIYESGSGRETLEKILLVQPDVVLLDLNLPDMPGHEAAQRIRQLSSSTRIVLCSFSDPSHLTAMVRHVGADGYFAKGSSPDNLHKTITAVLAMRQGKQKSEEAARES